MTKSTQHSSLTLSRKSNRAVDLSPPVRKPTSASMGKTSRASTALDAAVGSPTTPHAVDSDVGRGRTAPFPHLCCSLRSQHPRLRNQSKFTATASTCPLHSRSTRPLRSPPCTPLPAPTTPLPSGVGKLASLLSFLFFVWVGLPAEQEL